MQIHEITKAPLQEALLDYFSPAASAARSAKKLQAQGVGQEKPLPTVQDAVRSAQQNPAQQQYIKGLVAQWAQVAPTTEPAAATTVPPGGQAVPPGAKVDPTPNVDVGGKMMMKGDDGLWYDEDGRPTDKAGAEKLDKQWYTGNKKVKGTVSEVADVIKEKSSNARQARRAKNTKRTAGTSAGAPGASENTNYQTEFVKWAAGKLRTVDPHTRQLITLDLLNKTDIKDELDRALAQVVATAGDAQKNAVAVNNYLTIAVAGVTRESQRLKSNSATDDNPAAASTAGAGQGIVTQQEIRDKLSRFSSDQVEQLKQMVQDPAERRALFKNFGIRA